MATQPPGQHDLRFTTEFESVFQQYIETHILEHAELVQTVRATSGSNNQPIQRGAPTNWTSLKEVLALLAFAPDSTDHWRFLGVPREEGPFPNLEMIERRIQLGLRFASISHSSTWPQPDMTAAKAFAERLE